MWHYFLFGFLCGAFFGAMLAALVLSACALAKQADREEEEGSCNVTHF